MDLSPRYQETAEKFAHLAMPLGVDSVSQRFLRAVEVANTISPAVDLARREFLSICLGNTPESQFSGTLCFPLRFLGGSWKSQDIAESCSRSIQEVFDLGVLTHFAFTDFPTRLEFRTVNPEESRDSWLPESLRAPLEMRNYSVKVVPHVPIEGFFNFWYERAVKDLVKSSWRIGLFKRSRVRSYFQATFLTGLGLAFQYDLATKAGN
jgi:hypothetical protein